MFIQQPTQGAMLISNVPHNIVDSAKTIAQVVRHTLDLEKQVVEVTQEAEDAWLELLKTSGGRMTGAPDCTPGYYNNEGKAPPVSARYNLGYPQGAASYFDYIDQWRKSEEYEGLAFY